MRPRSSWPSEFGTPLFVYDEAHLRARCREAVAAFGDGVAYAPRRSCAGPWPRLAHEEGMHLDVATGGELHVALAAGVPAERARAARQQQVDRRAARGPRAPASGASWSTASTSSTGSSALHADDGLVPAGARCGSPRASRPTPTSTCAPARTTPSSGSGCHSGDAAEAVERARPSPPVDLVGIHVHIGSQVFVADFFHQAVEVLAPFVREHGLPELSIGGGLAWPTSRARRRRPSREWGDARCARPAATRASRPASPPSRAARSSPRPAVTLYTVGTIKDAPGIRTYVAVDGGMSDNPRPVLYGSGYETFLPRAADADRAARGHGRGQALRVGRRARARGAGARRPAVGDVLATPVTGAYGHSMGSNYNKVPRPAVVFVADGDARLVVRRETLDDLLAPRRRSERRFRCGPVAGCTPTMAR